MPNPDSPPSLHPRSPRPDKALAIGQALDALYPAPEAPLQHRDPFTLLVAVLLSAQCTDARVNQVTPKLWAVGDTPQALMSAPYDAVLAAVRPCGLGPSKAKNIIALSRQLVERYGGQVPQDWAALEALPGVGHKTASVVMTQAFGLPAFPVDTHIFRLARRWGLSDAPTVEGVEADLKGLYTPADWGKRHLQIIFFGREHCPARGHHPTRCPICAWANPEGGAA
jgi:endonuclease-3